MGKQHQGMERPGVRQVPEGSGEQGKMEKTGCKIICGAPETLAVKGLMMLMMNQYVFALLVEVTENKKKSTRWWWPLPRLREVGENVQPLVPSPALIYLSIYLISGD